MINEKDHPVTWAMLIYELDDAKEHLEALIKKMSQDEIDEQEFRILMGHIYAHLNRACNSRNDQTEDLMQEKWDEYSQFPSDIELNG